MPKLPYSIIPKPEGGYGACFHDINGGHFQFAQVPKWTDNGTKEYTIVAYVHGRFSGKVEIWLEGYHIPQEKDCFTMFLQEGLLPKLVEQSFAAGVEEGKQRQQETTREAFQEFVGTFQ